MTRAVYTQCKSHQDLEQHLLATEDKKIICNTQYDYFSGCGRDRRAHNTFGKVLMNVRNKLKEEKMQEEKESQQFYAQSETEAICATFRLHEHSIIS